MSHIAAKTNYVRPNAKTSYIRPLFCHNEKENIHKGFVDFSAFKSPEFPNKASDSLNTDSLKSMEDTKEEHIQNLNSTYSKLYAEIDKIHTWTASTESECRQKDKKVDELNQKIESQRKVLINIQMQNESLSTKLDQEIQQRVSVLEKFYLTKELFSTLRKKFIDLQEHFNESSKVKKTVDLRNEENTKAFEGITKKLRNLSAQFSENIVTLNNSLKNEKNNNLMLKKLFEQQNLSAEKEHKSLCKLIENYQEEIKNYSQDLECERNKVLCLQQQKNNLLQKITQLEKSQETNIQKLEDVEKQLQLTLESKLETEKKYSLENIKVNDLSKNIEELEELVNKNKNDFEEKILALKKTINFLENSLSESNQKLEECKSEKQKLYEEVQEREKEKCSLNNEILEIRKEKEDLQNKLTVNAKTSEDIINSLMEEKNDLMKSVGLLKDDLQKVLSDKEKLSEVCLENNKRISEMTKEYEIAAAKVKELSLFEEKYIQVVKKVEEMDTDMQLQSSLLASKEQEINELHQLKLKYDECLLKIKEHECNSLSLSDELKMKEMKINELTASEENLKEALIKIEALELDLFSKDDILISKEQCIQEMNSIKENYDSALEKIKEMEEVIEQKTEFLQQEKKKVMDLTGILKENNKQLEKLEYENLEIRDCLEKDNESLKVCLECDILKEKMKELDNFRTALMDTENELNKQRLQTSHVTKMLSETEENFDKMRIKKEKEIIKCKDTIQTLQLEVKILKVEVGEVEKIKHEYDKLRLTLEETKLQNAGDVQRLKAEIEALKVKNNASALKSESAESKMPIPVVAKEKPKSKSNEVMEPDSSDEVTIIDEERSQIPSMYKKFSKVINQKVMTYQAHQSTPLANLERKKRAWETESSGSECLEIIFDKNAKKAARLTPKAKSPHGSNRTPVNLVSDAKRRDLLEITDREVNFTNSPGKEQVAEIKTPRTPTDRKFFKTPLKERDPFKKPQLQKFWF